MNLELLDQLGKTFLQENNTSGSNTSCSNSVHFSKSIDSISIVILAFGFVGNFATFMSIVCLRRLRKPTYVFIASLSVADVCCLVIQCIARFYFIILRTISIELFMSIMAVFAHASLTHVIALSIFRLQMIKHPLQFKQRMTNKKAVFCIIACWIVGLFIGILIYIISTREAVQYNVTFFIIVLAITDVVIPQLILLTVHLVKVQVIRKASINKSHMTPHIQKLSKMACLIILINVLTILPMWTGFLGLSIATKTDNTRVVRCYFMQIALILVILHHSLNPVILFFISNPFQNIACVEKWRKNKWDTCICCKGTSLSDVYSISQH